ncbi:MFS transporter [Francisellaceae bacterium]|nr:MFS transporter [Francisellaceae bacterium]
MKKTKLSDIHPLDDLPLNKQHWKILTLAAMGVFLDGFDLFIIGVAIPLIIDQWHISLTMAGVIGAAAPLGAIIGAGFLGRFTDRFGRKMMLLFTVLVFVIFNATSALSTGPMMLIITRFLLGVGIGADYPTGSTYVSEIMPAYLRGKMLVGSFSFQALGALSGAAFGLLILYVYPDDNAWRIMLGAGAVPAIILFALRFSLPESPRWLINNGKTKKANKVASKIVGKKVKIKPEKVDNSQPGYLALFKQKYLKRTILTSVPWFLMDVSLYGVVFFTPMIIEQIVSTSSDSFIERDMLATKSAMYLDIFLIIGVFAAFYLVEKWGRIKLQKVGFIGMFIGLLVLAVSNYLGGGAIEQIALFVGFILFNFMVNMGPNPTTYMLPAEIFPTRIRGTGHGFAAATGKVGAAVGIFLLPTMKEAIGLGPTMFIISGTALLGYVITQMLGIETQGKSLDEIDALYDDSTEYKSVE